MVRAEIDEGDGDGVVRGDEVGICCIFEGDGVVGGGAVVIGLGAAIEAGGDVKGVIYRL